MGKLGQIGEIQEEAGVVTHRAISLLDKRLIQSEKTLSTISRNNRLVIDQRQFEFGVPVSL